MAFVEICLVLAIIGLLLFKWSTGTFKAFKDRNLYFEKPHPFVGNMGALALQKA
ncbi:GM20818 [Drosophila sechellia]|uniref:GM20818 n=3 Tax=Drosophila sechellia TaxID=7238 RepID=B4HQQ5_DROSE|nr:GM20818 [Drosophila sechellia]